jgi:Fe-S cluster assembly protein SufB
VNIVREKDSWVEHEASVSRLSEEKVFYLMSRGMSREAAEAMMVNGFLEPIIKEIPLEYAAEMNRLVSLEMEGSVG